MVSELACFGRIGALALAGTVWLTSQPAKSDSLADTFATVHRSLVLVATQDALGTGFIVKSDAASSEILTAAHVLGTNTRANVYLNDDPSIAYRATVTKIDATKDLCILTISKGALLPLDIASETREGASIAVAGYPYASLKFLEITGELKPSVHEGVVSSLRLGGDVVEYSAVTDHGNSGGPVFEADSGYVIGVVKGALKNANGAYEAIGIPEITSFLASAGVTTNASYLTSATLPNVPGAYHIVVLNGDLNPNPEQATMLQTLTNDLAGKVAQQLGVRTTIIPQIDISDVNAVSSACRDQNAIGVLGMSDGWSVKTGLWNSIDANVVGVLEDCASQRMFYSKKTKNAKVGSASVSADQIVSTLQDLNDQVAADLRTQADAVNQTALKNFLRYGYFIADGDKKSMFLLVAAPGGAEVKWVDPRGTAARAGLQVGDVVTALNGQSLAGVTQDALMKLILADAPSNKWTLTVSAADGKPTDISFEGKDIRWYLSHPIH